MKKVLLVSALFRFLTGTCVYSQQSEYKLRDSVSGPEIKISYFHDFFKVIMVQATSPFHLHTKDFFKIGYAGIISEGLFLEDISLDNSVKNLKSKSPFVNSLSPVITKFGAEYSFLSVGMIGFVSLISKNHYAFNSTLLATEAMISSMLWTQVIKQLAERERPRHQYNSSSKTMEWEGPFFFEDGKEHQFSTDYNSFVSGHTANAFSIATVFAMRYHDQPLIPIVSYSLATLVGLSRMTEHAHWASDVFVGACLGYLCGKSVIDNYRKLNTDSEKVRLRRKRTVNYSAAPFNGGIKCYMSLNF